MQDTLSKLQDKINDNFVSVSGTTETYSYGAVIQSIQFFIDSFDEKDFQTKVIPVTETKGTAYFSWREEDTLQQYSFIYLKDWKEKT